MKNMKRSVSIVGIAAILSACGGGGGDSDKGSNTDNSVHEKPVAPTAALLSISNYQEAAQEALNSSSFLLNSASLATGAQAGTAQTVLSLGEEQTRQLLKRFGNTSSVATGVALTETEACPSGGSITYAENDRNNNGRVDAGDSATMTANRCNLGNGVIMNGQLSMVANSVVGDGDTPPFALDATITFNQFEVSSGSSKATGNGEAVINLSAQSYVKLKTKLKTQAFTLAISNANVQTQQTLKSYTATSEVDGSITTASTDGTLITSNLGNKSILIATPTAFTINNSLARYPYQGVMNINGANKTAVRITAIDSTSVKLELDADGDGSYEVNQILPWSQML